jgi:hypothetical protein
MCGEKGERIQPLSTISGDVMRYRCKGRRQAVWLPLSRLYPQVAQRECRREAYCYRSMRWEKTLQASRSIQFKQQYTRGRMNGRYAAVSAVADRIESEPGFDRRHTTNGSGQSDFYLLSIIRLVKGIDKTSEVVG